MAKQNPKALVVDDDPAFRTLCKSLLAQHGYDIVEADGCDAAMSLVKANARDLVVAVVDMVMKPKDGIATIKALHGVRLAICVVGVTELTENAIMLRRALDGGACHVVLKDSFDQNYVQSLDTLIRRSLIV